MLKAIGPQFTIDEVIAQKYQIIELIGQPDRALLYKARNIQSNNTVNIRVLLPGKPLTDKSKQRFLDRMSALSSLKHPNIVSIQDFGILDNGILYLTTDYLNEWALANVFEERKRLDFQASLPIFKQICQALTYAHNQGVAHGAIRPENILITQDNNGNASVQLTNFRIAQFARSRANEKTSPEFEQIFADPTYMSPEECQGVKIDGSSDIYSLGCVMYEAFAGVPPYADMGGTRTLYMHVCEPPLPMSKFVEKSALHNQLEIVILKALEKEPSDRYQSAEQLWQALESVQKISNAEIDSSLQGKKQWNSMVIQPIKTLLKDLFISNSGTKALRARNFSGINFSNSHDKGNS